MSSIFLIILFLHISSKGNLHVWAAKVWTLPVKAEKKFLRRRRAWTPLCCRFHDLRIGLASPSSVNSSLTDCHPWGRYRIIAAASSILHSSRKSSLPLARAFSFPFPFFLVPFPRPLLEAARHGRPGSGFGFNHRSPFGGEGQPSWQAGAALGIGDSLSLHQGP
jgi:hypothetical protein